MSDVEAHFYKDAKPDNHQLRRRREILGMLSGLEGRILDYGCGWGDLTYQFSKTNPAVGVDLDPERVAFAQQEYAPIEFSQCRTDGVDFPDESFDIVVSTVVINFVPDAMQYLSEISRVLTPSGHLLICVRNQPVIRNLLRRIAGQNPVNRDDLNFLPSQAEMLATLDSAGYDILKRSCFYDPPFKDWKGIRDVIIGSTEQFLSLFKYQKAAPYYTLLCRKRS